MSRKTIAKTIPREERLAVFTASLYVGPRREETSMAARLRFRPRVTRVPGDPELHLALACLARGPEPCIERPVLLDSAAGAPRRFSLLGFDPLVAVPGGAHVGALAGLRGLLARLEPGGGDALPPGAPFAGG